MTSEETIAERIDPNEASAPDKGLSGNMGAISVMFTVLSFNGPLVVFMGFLPVAILMGNRLGTPVMWLAFGVLVALLAAGLLRVAARLSRPGGFYAIITSGLGRVFGLGSGFAALIAYFAALVAQYGLAGVAISGIANVVFHSGDVPWWIGGLIALLAVNILGYFNISFSAKALTIFLSLELILIASYCIAVLIHGGAHGIGLESFTPKNIFSGSLPVGALFAIGLFGGFEATVIFRDEVRDPDRTIPRATYGFIVLITVIYGLLAWCFINSYGASAVMSVLNANSVDAAQNSVRQYVGPFAYYAAVILLLTSAFALCLSAHNILSRYMFNMSIDGVFPKSMGQSHPRHRSPHRASLVAGIVSLLTVGALAIAGVPNQGIYGYLVGIYSYVFLVILVFVSLAIAVYLFRTPRSASDRIIAWVTTALFVFLTVILIYGSVNFQLLSGLSGVPGVLMLSGIWAFVLSGVVLALVLKRTRPEVFLRIGRQ